MLLSEYSIICTLMEQKLNDETLTVSILKDNLSHTCKNLIMAKGTHPVDNFGMVATDLLYEPDDYAFASAHFKGLCRNCGQTGHVGAQCPIRTSTHMQGRGGRGLRAYMRHLVLSMQWQQEPPLHLICLTGQAM